MKAFDNFDIKERLQEPLQKELFGSVDELIGRANKDREDALRWIDWYSDELAGLWKEVIALRKWALARVDDARHKTP